MQCMLHIQLKGGQNNFETTDGKKFQFLKSKTEAQSLSDSKASKHMYQKL